MASSIDAIPTEALETLLECSVCLETLNDPRTLSCFHSFCRCCLENFVQRCRKRNENPQLNIFECPVCRSQFTVNPQKGVQGIRTNHFVRNMLDIVAVERRVKGIPCHHCMQPECGGQGFYWALRELRDIHVRGMPSSSQQLPRLQKTQRVIDGRTVEAGESVKNRKQASL